MRVEDVYQDSQGFVWIATADGGVSRFDGVHFDNLSVGEGLPHPTVTSIAEWKGLLWFATFGGGLASCDGRRFGVYTTAQGLPSDDILKLRVTADGRLAVATMRGVGWFAQGRCQERIETVGGQPVGPVYDLLEDHRGRVWLATMQRGVVSAGGQHLQAHSPEGRDILHYAWNLAVDHQGNLWIASNYVGAAAYALRHQPGAAQPEVLEIAGADVQSPLKYGVRHVRADRRGWVWHVFRGGLCLRRGGLAAAHHPPTGAGIRRCASQLRGSRGQYLAGVLGRGTGFLRSFQSAPFHRGRGVASSGGDSPGGR